MTNVTAPSTRLSPEAERLCRQWAAVAVVEAQRERQGRGAEAA